MFKLKQSKQLAARLSMRKIITLAIFCGLPLYQAFAENTAIDLLNKMKQALHHKSYEGELIHIKNNEVITLKASHTFDGGKEVENVQQLNKEGEAYSRKVTDYSLSKLPKFDSAMQAVYSFDLGNVKKVAERPCQVVVARPKDRLRYLQKYCVDKESSLLLEYIVIDKTHKVIERFMFTKVKVLDSVELAATEVKQKVAPASARKAKQALQQNSWSLKNTPKGFKLSKGPALKQQNSSDETEHYILSDGLSSVSIFISKNAAASKQTRAKSGALNVVTYNKNGFSVTLIGEVPESTLKDIFNNLQHKK